MRYELLGAVSGLGFFAAVVAVFTVLGTIDPIIELRWFFVVPAGLAVGIAAWFAFPGEQ